MTKKKKKLYRILSLDGGGVRGLFTLGILGRINNNIKNFIKNIDLVAGTSTGGIIALGIAAKIPLDKMVSLYKNKAKKIFEDSWWDDARDLWGATGAEYSSKNLEKLMKQYFGEDLILGDLGKKVLIPAFKLMSDTLNKSWKSKYFNNYTDEEYDWYEKVYRVAMRTSAAPTYFPTYDGYIDGGVIANNPCAAALYQAISLRKSLGIDISDIRVLSIGTGCNPNHIDVDEYSKQKDWGAAQWIKPLIDVMIDGSMNDASFFCHNILEENFMRINMDLPKKVEMDTTKSKKLNQLIDWGKETYDEHRETIEAWMKKNWK